jgi:hypothetical protein
MKHAFLLFALTAGCFAAEPEAGPKPPPVIQHFVAIDNVCAWPILTTLRDGSINATLFSKPSHGQMEGAVECWNSAEGNFWAKRGVPVPNEPHTNRMNTAAGLAKNGDLIVLCSGWTDVAQPPRPKQAPFRDDVLRICVARSADGGKTWTQSYEFPKPDAGWTEYIPFGDIQEGDDGALHVACYGGEFADPAQSTKTKQWHSWHFRSDDDGRTWQRTSLIGRTSDETTLLHLGGKRWMAAGREKAVDLFVSEDDGATWGPPQRVTATNEINGQLSRLADGRLLLSYGNRVKGQTGVLAKLSGDEGKTWGAPVRVASTESGDCGYPSSVQRADRKIVTAWYSKNSVNHERYHMGVAIWSAPAP